MKHCFDNFTYEALIVPFNESETISSKGAPCLLFLKNGTEQSIHYYPPSFHLQLFKKIQSASKGDKTSNDSKKYI